MSLREQIKKEQKAYFKKHPQRINAYIYYGIMVGISLL